MIDRFVFKDEKVWIDFKWQEKVSLGPNQF
jgi:hypothetical protein